LINASNPDTTSEPLSSYPVPVLEKKIQVVESIV